jgi:ribonucleases P/MRP protein subunit RPP40
VHRGQCYSTHISFTYCLISLHFDRIYSQDRVDPYLSVYEPPEGSYIGTITHLRYQGLLSASILARILGTLVQHLIKNPQSFIAITGHTFPSSPVAYIPPSALDEGASQEARVRTPLRARGPGTHDTWSAIMSSSDGTGTYILAENIGGPSTR